MAEKKKDGGQETTADEAEVSSFGLKACSDSLWRKMRYCWSRIVKGSPPQPCDEVRILCNEIGIGQLELLQIYDTFHQLKEGEDYEGEVVHTATQLQTESILSLVTERRKWVQRLLRGILALGDVAETTSWDEFLWILIRFCSLSKTELCQAAFVIITREVKSTNLVYLTYEQLDQFYAFYDNCSVKAFCTKEIDWSKFPLTRYYVNDYVEVAMRFQTLINPFIHLQQALQERVPSWDFWDEHLHGGEFCRKITMEFFTMNQTRVHLRGEPPFRESCDALCPDSVGALVINHDQWRMRTRGLRPVSVWGEQISPEEIERQRAAEEALQRKKRQDELRKMYGLRSKTDEEQAEAIIEAMNEADKKEQEYKDHNFNAGTGLDGTYPVDDAGPYYNLTVAVSCTDEDNLPPVDLDPPRWMRGGTVAPAPRVPGPDPPLPRRLGRYRDRSLGDTYASGFSEGTMTGSAFGAHNARRSANADMMRNTATSQQSAMRSASRGRVTFQE